MEAMAGISVSLIQKILTAGPRNILAERTLSTFGEVSPFDPPLAGLFYFREDSPRIAHVPQSKIYTFNYDRNEMCILCYGLKFEYNLNIAS